jgi:hypothetical protein
MKRRCAWKGQVAVAVLAGAGAVALGSEARADTIMTSMVGCIGGAGAIDFNEAHMNASFGELLFNQPSGVMGTLWCPVVRLANSLTTSVTLDVWKPAFDSIHVKACRVNVGGFGGLCGTGDGDAGTGIRQISPITTSSWTTTDYRLLVITLKGSGNVNNMPAVFGYREN